MHSELTADEHTVLLIAGKGENMIPIGRWEKPIKDLADRGLMREIDSVNYVITAKGRRALENEEQAENEALKGAINRVRGVMQPTTAPDFDEMSRKFTSCVRWAADWKNNYSGAAYATRIKAAIVDLKAAIAEAESHPEIGG